jgi:probable F420-dependent oxidoreductase
MRIGVVFPQTELGGDAGALRAYGQAVEALGYTHLLAYDHVVGADPAVHIGWTGPYDVSTTFHEPFVMFGYLAGVTAIELVTGIIILPQRQTVLVAKQAAEVDLLTRGHFRLGVGLGWNRVEYEALGQPFDRRGRRLSEQIAVLRRLWTETSITHTGSFDTVTGAGIAPLPIQRPIPIWIGGGSDPALRRVGRLADGWFPRIQPDATLRRALDIIGDAAREAGRDPGSIGMEPRVGWSPDDPDRFSEQVETWRQEGASHLTVDTMSTGQHTVDDHIAALQQAAGLIGVGAQPAGDETAGFETQIKPMFRESDRRAMRRHFDLWSYDDVDQHADAILARLRDGTMPCDGSWPGAQIDRFQRWVDNGKPR